MNKKDHIDKLVEDTLNSFDGAARAIPKPYLFTRLHARMHNANEGAWDKLFRFISTPSVAMTALCLIIIVNALVVKNNYSATIITTTEEQYASAYEYNNSVAVLDDIENIEP